MPCCVCGRPSYTKALMSSKEWCREHYAGDGADERDRFLRRLHNGERPGLHDEEHVTQRETKPVEGGR